MKTKFTIFLLTLVSLFAVSQQAIAEEIQWTDVSTAQEFKNAIKTKDGNGDYTANVRLTADIDLSSLEAESSNILFNITFKGRINGEYTYTNGKAEGHVLKNSKNILFDEMKDASVDYVILKDCYFDGRDTGSGQLAIQSTNCRFNEVALLDCSSKGDKSSCDCDQMGGLIGKADGCTFTNVLVLNTSLTTDGKSAGLIVGKAENCHFDLCLTNFCCSIWADGNDYNGFVGGLCGYATTCSFNRCTNIALVSSNDDEVGGIVGHGDNVTMTECSNSGFVCHDELDSHRKMVDERNNAAMTAIATGLVGARMAYLCITVWADGAVLALSLPAAFVCIPVAVASTAAAITYTVIAANYEPDEAGGIIGSATNGSSMIRCSNYGTVRCYDANGGGIAGYAEDSSIKGCLNQAHVYAQEEAGGIVGYIKNCTVRNNLNMCVASAYDNPGMIDGQQAGDNNYGNNFFLDRKNAEYTGCKAVTQSRLASGEITLALNQGIRDDEGKDSVAFRQNLGKSIYPTLDPKAGVVTATTTDYDIWQKVSNKDELMRALTNLSSHIELTNDIDLTGNHDFALFNKDYPFCGEIKGNGHAIKNMSYQVTKDRYSAFKPANAALFAFCEDARFENITLENFHLTQLNDEAHDVQAILTANSTGCTYKGISLHNCSIDNSGDYISKVAGLVAISTNDDIEDCSTSNDCRFAGLTADGSNGNADVAGIAATAAGTTFTNCYNAAAISSDWDHIAGIAGYADNVKFTGCLNVGTITSRKATGGIVGRAKNTDITHCVNTGIIKDESETKEEYRGGIVGTLEESSSISGCINFGEIEYPAETNCGAIDGKHSTDVTYGDGNLYHCQYDGQAFSNINDEEYAKMTSGEYASGSDWLYQSIDNDPFVTKLPVPIPAAGKVYSNVLCDQSQSQNYSNYYHAEKGHLTTDFAGICSLCGNKAASVPQVITISNDDELMAFAHSVNSGVDFSNSVVGLTCDIDLKEDTDFMPIGIDADHPFKGTFTGNSHRIKNLNLRRTNDKMGTGLFGCVSGSTTITDLVIDSTCTVSSTSLGVAGLVGCHIAPSSDSGDAGHLSLYRCGNEAKVTGYESNAAGLVGGIYNNDASTLNIYDCYNKGEIQGAKESAAIVAYGGKALTVNRCWNTGLVSGYDANASMIRYASDATTKNFDNIYQRTALAADANATACTTEDFAYGTLCNELIQAGSVTNPTTVWAQNLGTDSLPQLANSVGIYHQRNMSSKWGTVVLPYPITSNSEVQLYMVESCDASSPSSEGTLTLKPVETVDTNTPCFFRKLDDSASRVCFSMSGDFSLYDDDPESIVTFTDASGWSAVGSYDKLSDLKGVYYMATGKLWFADEAICLPAYRAYLTYTNSDEGNNAKCLSICVDDDFATAICNADASKGSVQSEDLGSAFSAKKFIYGGKLIIIKDGKLYDANGIEHK